MMPGPARRCTPCGLSWPNANQYGTCPVCKCRTDPIPNDQPMSASEARHVAFDAFYADRKERLAREAKEASDRALKSLDAAATEG